MTCKFMFIFRLRVGQLWCNFFSILFAWHYAYHVKKNGCTFRADSVLKICLKDKRRDFIPNSNTDTDHRFFEKWWKCVESLPLGTINLKLAIISVKICRVEKVKTDYLRINYYLNQNMLPPQWEVFNFGPNISVCLRRTSKTMLSWLQQFNIFWSHLWQLKSSAHE